MKVFKLLIIGLVLITLFVVPAIAQKENPPIILSSKVAVIDSDAFGDEQLGVKELVIAYDKLIETKLKPQFSELKILSAKLQELYKEILRYQELSEKDWTGHSGYYSEAQAKFKQYIKLGDEFEIKRKAYKTLLEKYKPEIINPVMNKISSALEQFKLKKGYEFIFDAAKSKNKSFIIAEDDMPDITAEFIKFCNDFFDKEKSQ